MVQCGRGARLKHETIESSSIARELRRQKFQRDLAAQCKVFGFIDHAHPAAADAARDAVVRDGLVDHVKGILSQEGREGPSTKVFLQERCGNAQNRAAQVVDSYRGEKGDRVDATG